MKTASLTVACFALILFAGIRADAAVVVDIQYEITSAQASPIFPVPIIVPVVIASGTFTFRLDTAASGFGTAYLQTLNATVSGFPAASVSLPFSGLASVFGPTYAALSGTGFGASLLGQFLVRPYVYWGGRALTYSASQVTYFPRKPGLFATGFGAGVLRMSGYGLATFPGYAGVAIFGREVSRTPVPEPGMTPLLAAGIFLLLGAAAWRWRGGLG